MTNSICKLFCCRSHTSHEGSKVICELHDLTLLSMQRTNRKYVCSLSVWCVNIADDEHNIEYEVYKISRGSVNPNSTAVCLKCVQLNKSN